MNIYRAECDVRHIETSREAKSIKSPTALVPHFVVMIKWDNEQPLIEERVYFGLCSMGRLRNGGGGEGKIAVNQSQKLREQIFNHT